jgi:hypothetical protein
VPASIVLLTEEALGADDAGRLVALHPATDGGRPSYRVLVPADTDRNLLADVLDHLSLLQLREALDAARGHEEPTRTEAAQALEASLVALRSAGAEADGQVVEGDAVAAVETALAQRPADEVVVVTRPHAVEDTFHTDWASRARERLGVPVLHVYAGSSWLG